MSAPDTALRPRQVFTAATGAYLRSFVLGGALLLSLTLLVALVTVAALSAMPALARLQLPLVLDDAGVGVSPFGFAVLLAEVAVPGGIVILLVLGVSHVGLVRLLQSALSGGTPRFGASFVHGLHYCFSAAVAFLSVAAAVALIAVATPLLMVLGALGLLAALAARIAKQRLPIDNRWFVAAVIPFGAAAVLAWRASLAVPLIALEGHAPFAAIGRSVRLTRGAPWSAPLCLTIAFAAYFTVQALVDLTGPAGAPAFVVTLISLFTQVLTFAFPMAVLVVVTRALRDAEHPVVALPVLRRPLPVTAIAGAVTAALVLGFLTPIAPAASAFAEEGGAPSESQEAGQGDGQGSQGDGSDEAGDGAEQGGEVVDGDDEPAFTALDFRPLLSVLEGELTAPGAPITLWIEASTGDGGQAPYTFYFEPYLLEANGDLTPLHRYSYKLQAHGGGRTADFALDADQLAELGVGQHRFIVETEFVAVRGEPAQPGPTVEITHTIGTIDATTQVLLGATPTSFVADESVSLQATVTGDSGPVLAGTVTFQRIGDTIDRAVTVAVDGTGTARASFAGLSVGSHSFEATYRYAAAGVIATSSTVQVTALPYPVELELSAPASASEYGRAVAFPFTLTAGRGGLAPSGTVELRRGSEVLDSVALQAADFDLATGRYRGALTADSLALGDHGLTASYTSSDGQHQAASSNTVAHRVEQVQLTLELSSNLGWVMPRGSHPQLTVTIAKPDGAAPLPDGGTLEVEIGEVTHRIPLHGGQENAYLSLSDVDEDLDITARLTGIATHLASPATAEITMRAARTQAFVSLTDPALPGELQGFSAGVAGETSRYPIDGSIEVRVRGGDQWKSLPVTGGTAPMFEYLLGLGEHTIEARYVTARPNEFTDSEITELVVIVNRAVTKLVAAPPATAPRVGEGYEVTVTASNLEPYPVLASPAGLITATRGGQVVASAALSNGIATLALPATVAGDDELSFQYAGSDTHGSAATALTVPVELWPSSVSLSRTPETPLVGEAVELVATVDSTAPAALGSVVGGTVEFTRGGQSLGTATIGQDGTARLLTAAPLTVGSDPVRLDYAGVAGVIAAQHDTNTATVVAAPTSIAFEVTPARAHSRDRVEIVVRVSADPRTTIAAAGGTVTIQGSLTGSTQARTLEADGTAVFSIIAPLAEGQVHDFTLSYSGTAQLTAASTNGLISVDAAPVSVRLEANDRIVAGESTTVTVQLGTQGATPIPSSGNVDLYANGILIGSNTLTQGMGSRIDFSVAAPSQLAIGEHQLTARFRNSYGYQPATSDPRGFTVLGRETEVNLALEPSGSTPRGIDVTATALVNVVWSDDAPYGQVWLRSAENDQVLGQSSLSWSHADRTKATFTLSDLPIGVHEVYAEYLPSGNLNAASRSAVATLEVTGRAVALTPFYGAPAVGRNATVQVDVRDPNAAGGSPPGGEVDVLLGGEVVGTAATSQVVGALTSRAVVTVPLQRLTGGDHEFTVRFRSTDEIHSFAERSDTVRVARLSPRIDIVPVGDLSRLRWGDDFYVNVYVNRSTEAGGDVVPLPSGALTVRLENGAACVPAGVLYRCTPSLPGLVPVIAELAGDAYYVQSAQRLEVGTAGRRTPTLDVDLQPYVSPVETGTAQRLSWQLDGPGVRPAISGLPAAASCTGATSGACDFDFGLTTAGMAQTLKVSYAGDPFWEPVSWQRSVTPVGCYPLTLRAEPAGAGTIEVAVVDGAKCVSGNGYRAGTRVGVRATPADTGTPGSAYLVDTVGGRAAADAVGGLHWFAVGSDAGAGQVSAIVARFTHQAVCYPVTLQTIGYANTTRGSITVDTQPNCPNRIWWEAGSSPQQSGQRTSAAVGWYLAGTVLTVSAAPYSGSELYSARLLTETWAGAGSAGGATSATAGAGSFGQLSDASWNRAMPGSFTVDRGLRVQARFGVPCLPVSMTAAGPGSIVRETLPNCEDEFRLGEFQQGTEVRWLAQPHADRYAYVASASGVQSLGQSPAEVTARQGVQHYVNWALPSTNTAQLRFEQCRTLTIENLSPEYGSFEASRSDCQVGARPDEAKGVYRYMHGTEVQLSTALKGLYYSAPRFSSWKFPGALSNPARASLNVQANARFAITEDLALHPSFVRDWECSPVTVRSGDPLVEISVAAAPETASLDRCREGALLSGWTSAALTGESGEGSLVARARATAGNPKLGWTVTGTGADAAAPSAGVGTPGASLKLSDARGRTLTAYACQEVSSYLGLTDYNGEVGIAKQRDGTFIEISPAPNCPFSSTAWLIGTELTIKAAADERGYDFYGWGGVAVPVDGEPRSASYTVQADAPTVAVTALYDIVCHKLTVTGKAHRVTTLPEPNCPGAPQGPKYTGMYIGGTPVALIGEVPGGNVWQGWRGDLVETGKVKVAVAIMDADKTAEHRYRGKSWDEKALDTLEDIGDALAVAGKKVLGGVAYVAGKAIQEVPPFSLLGEAFEVLSLVGSVLEFIGVPKSITKYFDYPAQTLDWVLSGFNCLASASLSSQNGGSSANLSGVADSNQNAVYSAGGTAFRAIGIDPGDDNEMVGEALERLYVTGKSLGYAQKYMGGGESVGKAMDAIDTGLELYGMVTGPQGVGWDGSAADAWDKDMGNHILGCMAAATPDFIRGALPISDGDYDRYEEEYGL